MFRITPSSHESTRIEESEFSELGFKERKDIQEWVADNPSILGDDLLIISKEFSGFDLTNERLDLLAVDTDAKLVIIELKRDDSGKNAHWQAIKYASYLHHASSDETVRLLAAHKGILESEAKDKLLEHIEPSNLDALNNDQRIILASHRFAPEVTSAALWINAKSHVDNLITCVQLIPYRDDATGSLYIHPNTIIPVPGVDDYIIQIGNGQSETGGVRSGFAMNSAKTKRMHKNDNITRFLKGVVERVSANLPDDIKPDKCSKWAGDGGGANSGRRHYNVWYSRDPWDNWDMSYRVNLYKEHGEDGRIKADIGFACKKPEVALAGLADAIVEQTQLDGRQEDDKYPSHTWRYVEYLYGDSLDESFAERLARALVGYIEKITPVVNNLWNAGDAPDA